MFFQFKASHCQGCKHIVQLLNKEYVVLRGYCYVVEMMRDDTFLRTSFMFPSHLDHDHAYLKHLLATCTANGKKTGQMPYINDVRRILELA